MRFDIVLSILILINPISKVFLLSSFASNWSKKEIRTICIKSTLVAAGILVLFAFCGEYILSQIFRVSIYSFMIAGGVILFYRGFLALNKGVFFEVDGNQKLEEMSIAPLASPMIAGPATITAALTFPGQYGVIATVVAIIMALAINYLLMIFQGAISGFLKKFNLIGAFIRMNGLIVSTIGIQMILNGIAIVK